METDGAHADIQVPGLFASQFADPPLGKEPGELHLEKAILGCYETLGHDGIVHIFGIDKGHPFLVPFDRNRFSESGKDQFPLALVVVKIGKAEGKCHDHNEE